MFYMETTALQLISVLVLVSCINHSPRARCVINEYPTDYSSACHTANIVLFRGRTSACSANIRRAWRISHKLELFTPGVCFIIVGSTHGRLGSPVGEHNDWLTQVSVCDYGQLIKYLYNERIARHGARMW